MNPEGLESLVIRTLGDQEETNQKRGPKGLETPRYWEKKKTEKEILLSSIKHL